MVASGLPEHSGVEHAREIAIMALELSESLKVFPALNESGGKLRLRIGIHSGKIIIPVCQRVKQMKLNNMYRIVHGNAPHYLKRGISMVNDQHSFIIRHNILSVVLPHVKSSEKKIFRFSAGKIWSELPVTLRSAEDLLSFKAAFPLTRLGARRVALRRPVRRAASNRTCSDFCVHPPPHLSFYIFSGCFPSCLAAHQTRDVEPMLIVFWMHNVFIIQMLILFLCECWINLSIYLPTQQTWHVTPMVV